MSVLLPFSILGAPGDDALDVADVFSTDLYTGNGTSQSITNGVDLSGEGGLVWIKARSTATGQVLMDTARGFGNYLSTDGTGGENYAGDLGWGSGSFNSDGYTVVQGTNGSINANTETFVGWTFRRAPKFFDVVTYTGTGANRTIAHSLGLVPGMIIIKRTDTTESWIVYHRSAGVGTYFNKLELNSTGAVFGGTRLWGAGAGADHTDSEFYLSSANEINASGGTYVAYLFAHDTSDSGIIQCGSFATDGSGDGSFSLPWLSQWVLLKNASGTQSWFLVDTTRGNTVYLSPNNSGAESSLGGSTVTFGASSISITSFSANSDYIYMAIRAEGA